MLFLFQDVERQKEGRKVMRMRYVLFMGELLAVDELDATIGGQQFVKVSYTTAEMSAKFIVVVLTIQASITGTL